MCVSTCDYYDKILLSVHCATACKIHINLNIFAIIAAGWNDVNKNMMLQERYSLDEHNLGNGANLSAYETDSCVV